MTARIFEIFTEEKLNMGIVTKRGDSGKTSLFLGGRVAKDSPRIELVGELDELCSFLGLAKSLIKKKFLKKCLESVQKDLFCMNKEVVTAVKCLKRIDKRITGRDIRCLEKVIEELEAKFKLKKFCFCLPGKNRVSSVLHVSRTVARRAERRAYQLQKKGLLKNRSIMIYLNRLSDLLYLLAREAERE